MNTTKTVSDFPVFLRVFEGLPLFIFIATFLAISWLVRREPVF